MSIGARRWPVCAANRSASPHNRIDDTAARLLALDHVPERALATRVLLALKLHRALFLEGEPGTGKTEIAKTLATMPGRPLIRLQCHEGLDPAGAACEWNDARQVRARRPAL